MVKENNWTYERLNSIILLFLACSYIINFILGRLANMEATLVGIAVAYVGMYIFTYYQNKE